MLLTLLINMNRLFLLIPFLVLISACTKTSTKLETLKPNEISDTQRQREVCLDWYAYRIDTAEAITELNIKNKKEADLRIYCDFFKNVADTNQVLLRDLSMGHPKAGLFFSVNLSNLQTINLCVHIVHLSNWITWPPLQDSFQVLI